MDLQISSIKPGVPFVSTAFLTCESFHPAAAVSNLQLLK
jgi:hypothetical protein